MVLTKTRVLVFGCWAACLLLLVMLAEHRMISHSRARTMGHEIVWRSRHHHPQGVVDLDRWKRRALGGLHWCKAVSGAGPPVASTRFAVAALLTRDDSDMYTLAAIKLGLSLRWWFPPEQLDLVVMVTDSFGISQAHDFASTRIRLLQGAGWNVFCQIPVVESPPSVPGSRFHDSRVYSRLNVWGLTEYDAVLSLDLDTLVVRDPSPLFTHHVPAMLAANQTLGAARDRPAHMSDSFNAGVLLVIPNEAVLTSLMAGVATVQHDVDYAEQGYLNAVFRGAFHELPFRYNANVVSRLYEPELWRRDKSIAHFTVAKPWQSFRHLSLHHLPFLCWAWDVDDMCQLWDMVGTR